jgi:hypothetical protein
MAKSKDETTANKADANATAGQAGAIDQTTPVQTNENAASGQTANADQTETDSTTEQTSNGTEKDGKVAGAKTAKTKLITVSVRHKTTYPVYRRAGLVLRSTAKEEQVTAEQLETLKADPWVEVKEVATK